MKQIIIGLTLMLFSATSFALGTSSGGGGAGVRCFYDDKPSSIETLDYHEARLKGYKFKHSPSTKNEAVELTANLMSSHYFRGRAKYLSVYRKYLLKNYVNKIFNGQSVDNIEQIEVSSLPLSNDYGPYKIAPNCKLEQIAYLDDEKSILYLVRDLFNEMDELNKAILLTHEMIYFLDRHYPSMHEDNRNRTEKTSAITRSFVGLLFSTTRPKARTMVLEKDIFISCRNKDDVNGNLTEFDVYLNNDGTYSLLVLDSHGHRSPFRIGTRTILNLNKLTDFQSELEFKSNLTVSNYNGIDNLSFIITKKAYERPYFQMSRQGQSIGKLEEMICHKNK